MSSGDSSDVLTKKTINELKIAELRKELELRSVDHKGLKLKNNLIEALENVSVGSLCSANVYSSFHHVTNL